VILSEKQAEPELELELVFLWKHGQAELDMDSV
jgi:hypothetical protein